MCAAHSRAKRGTRGCSAEFVTADELTMQRCIGGDYRSLEGQRSGQISERPGGARRAMSAHNDDLVVIYQRPVRLQRAAPMATRRTRSGDLNGAKP